MPIIGLGRLETRTIHYLILFPLFPILTIWLRKDYGYYISQNYRGEYI